MSVTTDGGATWTSAGRLYAAGADADHRPGGVCGYPDIVSLGDDTLGAVLHTYPNDDGIQLQWLHLRDLVSSPTVRVDARGLEDLVARLFESGSARGRCADDLAKPRDGRPARPRVTRRLELIHTYYRPASKKAPINLRPKRGSSRRRRRPPAGTATAGWDLSSGTTSCATASSGPGCTAQFSVAAGRHFGMARSTRRSPSSTGRSAWR